MDAEVGGDVGAIAVEAAFAGSDWNGEDEQRNQGCSPPECHSLDPRGWVQRNHAWQLRCRSGKLLAHTRRRGRNERKASVFGGTAAIGEDDRARMPVRVTRE